MMMKTVVILLLTANLVTNIYYTVKHIMNDSYVCFSDRELALMYYLSTLMNMLLLVLVWFGW